MSSCSLASESGGSPIAPTPTQYRRPSGASVSTALGLQPRPVGQSQPRHPRSQSALPYRAFGVDQTGPGWVPPVGTSKLAVSLMGAPNGRYGVSAAFFLHGICRRSQANGCLQCTDGCSQWTGMGAPIGDMGARNGTPGSPRRSDLLADPASRGRKCCK